MAAAQIHPHGTVATVVPVTERRTPLLVLMLLTLLMLLMLLMLLTLLTLLMLLTLLTLLMLLTLDKVRQAHVRAPFLIKRYPRRAAVRDLAILILTSAVVCTAKAPMLLEL
jgi:hypothetical protein